MGNDALGQGTDNGSPNPNADELQRELEATKALLSDKEKAVADLAREKEIAEKARAGAMSAKDKLAEEHKKLQENMASLEAREKGLADAKAKSDEELVEAKMEAARLKVAVSEGLGPWADFLPKTGSEDELQAAAAKIKALAESERKRALEGVKNLEPPTPTPGLPSTVSGLRAQLEKAKTPQEADMLRAKIAELAQAELNRFRVVASH
jgi:hypothetical protein